MDLRNVDLVARDLEELHKCLIWEVRGEEGEVLPLRPEALEQVVDLRHAREERGVEQPVERG